MGEFERFEEIFSSSERLKDSLFGNHSTQLELDAALAILLWTSDRQ